AAQPSTRATTWTSPNIGWPTPSDAARRGAIALSTYTSATTAQTAGTGRFLRLPTGGDARQRPPSPHSHHPPDLPVAHRDLVDHARLLRIQPPEPRRAIDAGHVDDAPVGEPGRPCIGLRAVGEPFDFADPLAGDPDAIDVGPAVPGGCEGDPLAVGAPGGLDL